MLCAHCKGDDVVVDAWAEWSLEKQEWVLRTAFDNAYCIDCEEACDVDEVETHDPVSWVSPAFEHLGDFDEIKGCLPAGPLSMDNPGPIIAEHVLGADMKDKNNG
jgi:hypothetical protein